MVRRRRVAGLTRVGEEPPGSTTALIPDAFTICVEFRPADSLATSIPVGFSANPDRVRSARLSLELIHQGSRFVRHLQQLGPQTVIIFAGQLSRRVKSHVGPDVLFARRMVERVAWIFNDGCVPCRIRVRAQSEEDLT